MRFGQIGIHPDDGSPIELCNGPYGYYVKHHEVMANLRTNMDPWTLELETGGESANMHLHC